MTEESPNPPTPSPPGSPGSDGPLPPGSPRGDSAGHRLEFRFLNELKHRNVVRLGILYVIVCWLILEPVHVIFHMLEAPAWSLTQRGNLSSGILHGSAPVANEAECLSSLHTKQNPSDPAACRRLIEATRTARAV
jgi:hypothetical protein